MACPNGIDAYFGIVGGRLRDATLLLNTFACIPVHGFIKGEFGDPCPCLLCRDMAPWIHFPSAARPSGNDT